MARGFQRFVGGADGSRTHDLDGANVALSQLSYGPSTPYLAEVAGVGKGRRNGRGAAWPSPDPLKAPGLRARLCPI